MSTDLVDAVIANQVKSRQVDALIGKLLELPQPRVNVRHIYGPGVYMRELVVAAGILIVGREHRSEHQCILVRGRLVFFNGDGTQTEMTAVAEWTAPRGRKVARVEEDITFVNSWATDETDVETLEREIFVDAAPPDTRPMLPPDGTSSACSRSRGQVDFERVLEEQGASPEAVRRASERTDDCCPFPFGAYKVKVGRSLIEGRGLIATADIAAGEFIAPGTWGHKRTPAGRYTNHAKDPNAAFHYDALGVAWLVALKPIEGSTGAQDGNEITIDYRRTPRARWEMLS
jgi:hypothetical protein